MARCDKSERSRLRGQTCSFIALAWNQIGAQGAGRRAATVYLHALLLGVGGCHTIRFKVKESAGKQACVQASSQGTGLKNPLFPCSRPVHGPIQSKALGTHYSPLRFGDISSLLPDSMWNTVQNFIPVPPERLAQYKPLPTRESSRVTRDQIRKWHKILSIQFTTVAIYRDTLDQ